MARVGIFDGMSPLCAASIDDAEIKCGAVEFYDKERRVCISIERLHEGRSLAAVINLTHYEAVTLLKSLGDAIIEHEDGRHIGYKVTLQ